MLKTIIAPVDGSDHARKAVDLAGDLAGKYGARLVLLYVVAGGLRPGDVRALIDVARLPVEARAELERVEEEQKAAVAALSDDSTGLMASSIPLSPALLGAVGNVVLDNAENAAREHGAPDVNAVLMHGDPAKCILSLAEAEADMIVMGTRGLSNLAGLFVGSVSHKVNQLSHCTCITVR